MPRSFRPWPSAAAALAWASLFPAAGCSGSGGPEGVVADGAVGQLVAKPDGAAFFADPHRSGGASRLALVEIQWGRLVDVFGVDAEGRPLEQPFFRDYLINETIIDRADDWRLETNPISQTTRLVILREPQAPDRGDGTFEALLARVQEGLPGIQPKGLAGNEVTPFSFVVRNAALALRFDDLLDDDEESAAALPGWVRVLGGYPPVVPLATRVVFDPNHGGLVGGRFHSTRVLIDLTVSETEAADSPLALELNSLGLPRSDPFTPAANVCLRLPTRVDPGSGQFSVLHNASGRPLDPLASQPFEPDSPAQDLVRAMRSGNDQDPNNGFLLDFLPPSVVGAWPCRIEAAVPATSGGFEWRVGLSFLTPCRKAPGAGDTLAVNERFLEVTAGGPAPDPEGRIEIRARLLNATPTQAAELLGLGSYQTVFRAGLEVEKGCWVRFTPTPRVPPSADVPAQATVTLRFSEPMDPDTALPFDTFLLVRGGENVPPTSESLVVGSVASSPDLREMTFVPRLPLAHHRDRPLYHVRIPVGGVNDLAGNGLSTPLPEVEFSIDPASPLEQNASVVLRFDSTDELLPAGPDLRGQFLYQFSRSSIRPREPTFASRSVDRSSPLVNLMAPFPPGVATPISPLGSKLQAVWRYAEMGWSVRDESKYNLDVVGLHWSPARAAVSSDFYEQFEIRVAHSAHLPDEQRRSPITGGMKYPDSGLKPGPAPFERNLLVDPHSPQVVLRSRARNYRLDPRDLSFSATGLAIMPWPLDPPEEHEPFVWRDTAVLARGGSLGAGVPLDQEAGGPLFLEELPGNFFPAGQVPAVGLPLLIEFRCYPSELGIGLNPLAILLASNVSPAPNFRAYSTGGFDSMGQRVLKNPDLELFPTGGFNPGSRPPGKPTVRSADNSLYLGQLDFVPRVSRVHTIWIDTRATGPTHFALPVLEPPDSARPSGTSIVVDFRGATQFIDADVRPFNAQMLTPYGDPIRGTTLFYRNDPTWKRDPGELDGTPFIQMRISFFANTVAGLVAELSALGLTYRVE